MYDPDAENMYRQESQPYQPDSRQYIPQYPPQSVYPTNRPHPAQSVYQGYSSPPFTAEDNAYVQGEKIGVRSQPQSPRRKQGNVARTSKAQALAIVQTCKKWLIIGSVVCFGVFSGLAVGHVIGVTSQSPTNSVPQQQAAPANQGGFFQQQPQQQGGNNFGNNGTSQGPVSGSGVS